MPTKPKRPVGRYPVNTNKQRDPRTPHVKLSGPGIDLLAESAYLNGLRGNDLVTMTAMGMRESHGDPTVHNPVPPDDSYGLWQINVRPEANPKYKDWDLKNPLVNGRAMAELFASSGVRPWVGLDYGNARQFVPAARAAAARAEKKLKGVDIGDVVEGAAMKGLGAVPGGSAIAAGVNNLADAATSIDDVIDILTNPSQWLRYGKGVVGGVLVILGVGAIVYVTANKVGSSPAGSAAMSAVPAGRAATAVKAIAK